MGGLLCVMISVLLFLLMVVGVSVPSCTSCLLVGSAMCNCVVCGDVVDARRAQLGYKLCLFCGEEAARAERKSWCVAPMHKSNYMLITNLDDLKGLNNKGGLVK